MKKLFTLVLLALTSFTLSAQCPITTAVDFTATDCHGNEVHLFDILDGGQYVLIDFFFTSCQPCQSATPTVAAAYSAFGCNQHDVFFMEVSPSDNNAALENWVSTYNIEYPTIGTSSVGSQICGDYQIEYYPTVILIKPDRSIVVDDIWPVSGITSTLESFGITQHPCDGVGIEDFNADNDFVMYPNPANQQTVLTGNIQNVRVYNELGQMVWQNESASDQCVIPTAQWTNGVYFVRVNDSTTRKLVVTR